MAKTVLKSDRQKELCSVAAENIANAFSWDETPEGAKYWMEVHQRLCRFLKQYEGENGVVIQSKQLASIDPKTWHFVP